MKHFDWSIIDEHGTKVPCVVTLFWDWEQFFIRVTDAKVEPERPIHYPGQSPAIPRVVPMYTLGYTRLDELSKPFKLATGQLGLQGTNYIKSKFVHRLARLDELAVKLDELMGGMQMSGLGGLGGLGVVQFATELPPMMVVEVEDDGGLPIQAAASLWLPTKQSRTRRVPMVLLTAVVGYTSPPGRTPDWGGSYGAYQMQAGILVTELHRTFHFHMEARNSRRVAKSDYRYRVKDVPALMVAIDEALQRVEGSGGGLGAVDRKLIDVPNDLVVKFTDATVRWGSGRASRVKDLRIASNGEVDALVPMGEERRGPYGAVAVRMGRSAVLWTSSVLHMLEALMKTGKYESVDGIDIVLDPGDKEQLAVYLDERMERGLFQRLW